jgi:hypothetical protein
MSKYKVWEYGESIEGALDVEAENPGQAGFFAANIKKPVTRTEFVVAIGDIHTIVAVQLERWYLVAEVRKIDLPEDAPSLA